MVVSGEDGSTVSHLDDSSSTGSAGYNSSNDIMLNPLPVESPVNKKVTLDAIQLILPNTPTMVRNTPVNEIFHEEPADFHVMDTQVEKALLSTFITDDKEMEKDIGAPITMDTSLADELLAIVNDEPSPSTRMEQTLAPLAPTTNAALNTTTVGMPVNTGMNPFAMRSTAVSPLATGAVSEYNFPRKVYRMLEDAEQHPVYKEIVSWTEDGMSFKVHNKKLFVEQILPNYFDMTQYASFRRQLNMYSFERKHNSTYSNPFFAKGCPDLLKQIARKTCKKKNFSKTN